MPILRYGTGNTVCLEFAEGAYSAECGMPAGTPLADIATALTAALESPLDYPAVGKSTTPGDRVVVVLEREIPRVAQVTATLVQSLVAAGVAPDGITVLRSEFDAQTGVEDPCRLIIGTVGERVRMVTHDPADRRSMAYLAASEGGDPILLNRLLTDADLVLSVGCMQRERTTGYFGIHTAIFPEYSDHETQRRFRRRDDAPSGGGHHRELRREVDHVAWLLGVNFAIQMIPAAGDDVFAVFAGQSDSVRRKGRELYRQIWKFPIARRAELVVASIEGGPEHQTWDNLGRVLATASRIVEVDGAIAICSELSAKLGPAMQRLRGARSRDAALRLIRRDGPVDTLAAFQLAHVLERSRIYLLSRLDTGLVEELEMVPMEDVDDLVRLAHRAESCILLANAARAMVTIENE